MIDSKDIAQVKLGRCACGHVQLEHGQMTRYPDRENVKLYGEGHGGCDVATCDCPQFTWVGWSA